jgi:hypothetical protein
MEQIRIGFYSVEEGSGCTSNAVHAANYFINAGLTVALVEPKGVNAPIFFKLTGVRNELGVIERNTVNYYPQWAEDTFMEDVVIYDYGKVSYNFKFPSLERYFLCVEANEDTMTYLDDFFSYNTSVDRGKNTFLLKETSKAVLTAYKTRYANVFAVERSDKRSPQALASLLEALLVKNGIIPPSFCSSDWDLLDDAIAFLPSAEVEKQEKGKRFSLFGKRKKQEQKETDAKRDVPAEEQPQEEVPFKPGESPKVRQMDTENLLSASTMFVPDYDIPKPAPVKEDAPDGEPALPLDMEKGGETEDAAEEGKNQPEDKEDRTCAKEEKADEPVLAAPDGERPVGEPDPNLVEALKRGNELEKSGSKLSEKSKEKQKKSAKRKKEKKETKNKGSFGFSIGNLLGKKIQWEIKDAKEKIGTPVNVSDALACTNDDKAQEDAVVEEVKKPDISQTGIRKEKEKPSQKRANVHFFGHVTLFVTSLKHGSGESYASASIASAFADTYDVQVCLCHKKGTAFPQKKRIFECTAGDDFADAYRYNVVIFDRGIMGELKTNEMRELQRCDVKVLVSNGDEADIRRLAKFIHKMGDLADKWVYVFNLVPTQKRAREIKELMKGYQCLFLPFHDACDAPKKLKAQWLEVLVKNHEFY